MKTTIGSRIGLFMSVGAMALTMAAAAHATPADDARDARIAKLEAAVAALESRVEQDGAIEQQNAELKSEVTDLQAQVADLKTTQTAQTGIIETVQSNEPAKPSALATITAGKPTIASADGKFSATLHGILQFDAANYDQHGPGPIASDFRRDGPALGATATNVDAAHARDLKDGDLFRRARIGVDGVAYGDFDYRLIFDFAGSGTENAGQLYEGWLQYSGLKPFHLRVGAFSPSIGMEDQASTNYMPFLERSASSDIARGLAAGDTRTAVELFANQDNWLVSGAVTGRVIGVLNTGTASAVPQTFGDQLGLVGRIAINPFHGDDWLVHFGVHGSYVVTPPDASGPATTGVTPITSSVIAFSNTPELRVDGTKFLNTGNMDASHADTVGLEFAAQKANFLIQSEYEDFGVQRTDIASNPNFHGYYVEGLWMITGEARKYNATTGAFDGPPVAHPFSIKDGNWGAWELGFRYSDMDLNYHAGPAGTFQSTTGIRGGDEQNFTAGLNWYLNPVFRFMFDYQYVKLDRLSPALNASGDTTIWFTPEGAQIGQSYSVFSIRSQFAFLMTCLVTALEEPSMSHAPASASRRGLLTAIAGAVAATPILMSSRVRAQASKPLTITNVSYDPTRELYKDINAAYANYWQTKVHQVVTIQQSNGGSGAQARAVIDGEQADVVTLALAYDINSIAEHAKLLPANWQSRLPENSTPYTSTIVFLVKKGNPWKIHTWNDLLKPGISLIIPNPKTSGGARWGYLAAYASALKTGGSDAAARAYIAEFYKHVPVLNPGARGSTLTFTQRGIGDVLVCWENEAHLALAEFGADKFDIVFPPTSILAEPPVALVDKVVDRRGTRVVAEGYLNFLYSPLAQDLIGKNYYRPRNPQAVAKYAARFPKIPMVMIDDTFGGWHKAQATHFADGGVFDQIHKG